MPRRRVSFEVVREIGLALPDVEDGTAYGSPALKVRGALLACMAIHSSAELDTLAVRIDFDHREGLLADAPETYYLTDHYRGHPVVLVRMGRIGKEELRDLLGAAWRFVTATKKATSRRMGKRA
jgi:hypothetical protein